MLDSRSSEAPRGARTQPYALHHPRSWGAEPLGQGLWRFALWAPEARAVELDLPDGRHPMARDGDGFWRITRVARVDANYAFVVDGQATPDPLARAQASMDVEGPSRLVDPRRHAWTSEWRGRPWEEAVVYELHIGTFTPEGTFAAAARRLPELARLGITALEIMPVAHGPGARGWGYDGTLLAAPHPAYGSPEDLKRLVEVAQAQGIMVLLDVVLNHFGPQGSDMHRIAPGFFDAGQDGPWGAAIDFARPAVRAFLRDVALGWITEYRLDGLRFDAVQEIKDPHSDPEFMVELATAIRSRDFGRPIHLVNEDNRNNPTLIRDGLCTAQWDDDLHHSVHTLLTGEAKDYLAAYADDPLAKLMRVLAQGFAYEGEGAPPATDGLPVYGLPWTAFVCHFQNHDQVGNRPGGDRLVTLVDGRAAEVAHAMLLTSPFIPMLFMGEEEGERGPFHFFCDVDEELAEAVRTGRKEQFGKMFESDDFPDPNDPRTMEASRPFRDSGSEHARHWRDLTRRLLALRHRAIVPLLRSGRAGPAVVTRRGPFAFSATWPFRNGFIVTHLNLGGPPDEPPAVTEPHDFALGDVATDPYAIAVLVSRP